MVGVLKRKSLEMFEDLKALNLFIQKFNMLDHVVEDVGRYVDIILVDPSNTLIVWSESLYE